MRMVNELTSISSWVCDGYPSRWPARIARAMITPPRATFMHRALNVYRPRTERSRAMVITRNCRDPRVDAKAKNPTKAVEKAKTPYVCGPRCLGTIVTVKMDTRKVAIWKNASDVTFRRSLLVEAKRVVLRRQ